LAVCEKNGRFPTGGSIAQGIVDYLGDHNRFLSHARRVDIQALADRGAKIYNITDVDRQLWQLLEELWYVVEHTFQGTAVFKMWENSKGVRLFHVLKMVLTPTPEVHP
jgi:hypothetical protein